ncbi:MAG: NUDIX hydrolase [Planctomycetota bacterium]
MHEILLSTPRFTVERRTYPEAGSASLVREFVVHRGAVVILPVLDDGRIVLIRQLRRGVGEWLDELPAGTREPHEPPEQTAARELIEETGYEAACIAQLLDFYTSPGIITERMFAFLATGLQPVGQKLEAGETIEVTPRRPDEVWAMLAGGQFRDGKTIAVLGTYFLRQHGKVTHGL